MVSKGDKKKKGLCGYREGKGEWKSRTAVRKENLSFIGEKRNVTYLRRGLAIYRNGNYESVNSGGKLVKSMTCFNEAEKAGKRKANL